MYIPGIHTDHTAFYLGISQIVNERGRGYWKLNTNHLRDPNFIEEMNKTIDIQLLQSQKLSKIERWIYLKKKLTDKMKELSRRKANENDLIISQLSERLTGNAALT